MHMQPIPELLSGDNLRFQQILINLVKNALKFAVTGDVRIFVAHEEDEQLLKVHVVDNGKGIRSEDMGKLFSYFGKLKRTANINSEGIGMGLMICQNLVKMNKGTISVHSNGENQGSVFSFTMSVKPVEAQE